MEAAGVEEVVIAPEVQEDILGGDYLALVFTEALKAVSDAEEERMVREAVQRYNGNISAAAKALGISRPTLYAKMKKYGL